MLNPIHRKRAQNSPELENILASLLSYSWFREEIILKRINVRRQEPDAQAAVMAVVLAVTLKPEEADFLFQSLRNLLQLKNPPEELG